MKRYILLFIIFLIGFFCINNAIEANGDDWQYQYIFINKSPIACTPNELHPIKSFSDVLISQFNHYFIVNGRVPAHILAQAFCGLYDKWVYNILTTIIFGLLIFVFGKLCFPNQGNNKNKLFYYISSISLLLLLLPEVKALYTQIAFGCNYVWMTYFVLLALYLFFYRISDINNKILLFICYIFALLAGWSQEGLTIGAVSGMFVFYLLNKNHISNKQLFFFLAFSLGIAFSVFSPANFSRFLSVQNGPTYTSRIELLLNLSASGSLLIALLILYWQNKKQCKNFIYENISWITMWLVQFIFILILNIIGRANQGIEIYATILLMRILPNINFIFKYRKVFASLSIISLIGIYSWAIPTQYNSSKQYKDIYSSIKNSSGTAIVPYYCQPFTSFEKYVSRIQNSIPSYVVPYIWNFEKENVCLLDIKHEFKKYNAEDLVDDAKLISLKDSIYISNGVLFTYHPIKSNNIIVRFGKFGEKDVSSLTKNMIMKIIPSKSSKEIMYKPKNLEWSVNTTKIYIQVSNLWAENKRFIINARLDS